MTTERTKVLITGVAGFLGSNLLDRLMSHGHTVIGIDNLSMGSMENIAHHQQSGDFEFIQDDVVDPNIFDGLNTDFDCIVHLAAFKIPRYGKTIDTLRVNSRGTENVLDFASKVGCKCVLASTSDVYGQNPKLPFSEDDLCVIGPSTVSRWSYAVSKLFDEHLGFAYQESFDVPVTILRFFGSYGPRQHLSWWGGPQSVFIGNILSGEEVPIHGDGQQTRSFTYVSDTIDGIYAAMFKSSANGEIFNIGSTHEVTIMELAETIKRVSGTPGELRAKLVPYESFTGKRYEDVRRRVPDVSKCERILGVTARVGLEEGLRKTIEWQREATSAAPPKIEVERGRTLNLQSSPGR